MSEYAERDIEALCQYYGRHVSAMTGEGLHEKSDIAAELAHRDHVIDTLKAERDAFEGEVNDLNHVVVTLMQDCKQSDDDSDKAEAANKGLVDEVESLTYALKAIADGEGDAQVIAQQTIKVED